jgi:hypothetical protein
MEQFNKQRPEFMQSVTERTEGGSKGSEIHGRSHVLSHLTVRVLAVASIIDLVVSELSPGYSHTVANGPLGGVLTIWWIGSSIVLPLYVGFEFWWMRDCPGERRALLVDAALAVAWSLIFWATILSAFRHAVIL